MPEATSIESFRAMSPGATSAKRDEPQRAAQFSFAFAAQIPDAEARDRALRTDMSFVVEAPAGSGKTGLLIQRFLALLGSADVHAPEQVLAITFTRAAADEIRERLVDALENASAQPRDDSADDFAAKTRSLALAVLARDRERSWKLLEDSQRLRVRTIDSVCSEIVRMVPVMTGGGATLRPTEQPRALYAQAARQTMLQMGEGDAALGEAIETLLLHRNGSVAGCIDMIGQMLAVREQWANLLPAGLQELADENLGRRLRPALDRALEKAVCADLREAAAAIPRKVLADLADFAAEMSDRPGHQGKPSPLLCCAGCPEIPEVLAGHLNRWKALAALVLTGGNRWRKSFSSHNVGLVLAKAEQGRIAEIVTELDGNEDALAALAAVSALPEPRYDQEQWTLLRALFRVLARAQSELKRVFEQVGACDFVEMALLAQVALSDGSGPRSYDASGAELRHLLVDEMQDTSIGQYALLERLTEGWGSGGRSLFLVGDPKQSIYLFRQAKVERFVQVMQERRLGDVHLELLQLSANFRSRPALVHAANKNFSRIFPSLSTQRDAITHTEAVPFRPGHQGLPTGEVWHPAATAKGQRQIEKKSLVQRHAREIRRVVQEWRVRPLPAGRSEPWRIAVLVASRQELKPVVAEFRGGLDRPAVPFRAINVELLAEQPEVLDLLALTRALRHRADRVAWLAVLRAPWCGLSLYDLHQLAGGDLATLRRETVPVLMRERETCLTADGKARLQAVRPVLEGALQQSGRVYLPDLIEATWHALGADRYLGDPALRNAGQFFALLHDAAHQRGEEDLLSAVERRMEVLYAAPDLAEDAVDLTTIHKAKGLEWDVVLIPELDRQAPSARGRLLEWETIDDADAGAAGVVFAPIQETYGAKSTLSEWLRSKRADRLAAERKRLFYVAGTRAREALHLWATAEQRDVDSVTPPPRSLLEAAWPATAEHFLGIAPALTAALPAFAQPLSEVRPIAPGNILQLAAAEAESNTGQPWPADQAPDFGRSCRLPLESLLELHASRTEMNAPSSSEEPFARPEGSFRARSAGNAVHAFLEQAALRIENGQDPEDLLRDVQGWQSRIDAVLRNDGLGAKDRKRLQEEVIAAVSTTLRHPIGRWILSPHPGARSEHALTLPGSIGGQVRLDRLFRAGALPGSTGNSHLWIVDFKTGSPRGEDRDGWVEREKAKYQGQMATYAGVFPEETVHLGLWYPAMSQFIWWPR